jgi:hypothetical protein
MTYDDYDDAPDRQPVVIDVLRKVPALGQPSGAAPPRQPQRPADYYQQAFDLTRQAGELAAAPVDLGQIERLARSRAAGAGGDIAAGIMLSKLGGQGLSELGGHVLKNALAARGPQKIGGVDVVGGEAVRDPFRERDVQVQKLMAQASMLERMGQHRDAAEARDEARRVQEQHFAERRADRAAAQAEARAGRAEREAERKSQQTFQREHTLRGDYAKATKDINDQLQAAQQVQVLTSKPSGQMTAQDQQAIIFSFMKMLDPGSVVRESEYASAARARGLTDTISNYITQLQTGKPLTPKQVEGMRNVAKQMQEHVTTLRGDINQQFIENAQRYGVEPKSFIRGGESDVPQGAVRPRDTPMPRRRENDSPPMRRETDEAPDEPPPGAVRVRRKP